ncbi:PaaX family transcriptional regulator C-terminal domain-containing protein [Microbacterium sp. 22242]|uniref:PaaX family transcriptional regulator C-terminal domain-containing protein n=1 Tax=Microbacterium sp. 22242 TaxID=3453896 RepID=UPI003F8736B5
MHLREADARTRHAPHSTSVGFVFGALSAAVIPDPVLIAVLRQLGLTDTDARGTISRMRRLGWLIDDRSGEGPVVAHRLSPAALIRYRELEGTTPVPHWSGAFHGVVFDIDGTHPEFRDRFRRLAEHAGFGLLRPGVLIHPEDRWQPIAQGVGPAPEGSWYSYIRLVPRDEAEAAWMTARAWDLAGMADRYRAAIAEVTRTHDHIVDVIAEHDPWALLDVWHRMYGRVIVLRMDDPGLPEELLPADWPGAGFAPALRAVNATIAPQIQPYLQAEVSQWDETGDCVFAPTAWTKA